MEIVEIVGSHKAFETHQNFQNFSLNSVIKVHWQEGEKGVAEEE